MIFCLLECLAIQYKPSGPQHTERPSHQIIIAHHRFGIAASLITDHNLTASAEYRIEMFATRDQENLVHGHQQVAASKPLNQGARGLQPKTPGNKYPKTPLKIPLNDENAIGGGLGGKTIKGKGLENLVTAGKKATFDKSAFVTPLGRNICSRPAFVLLMII